MKKTVIVTSRFKSRNFNIFLKQLDGIMISFDNAVLKSLAEGIGGYYLISL